MNIRFNEHPPLSLFCSGVSRILTYDFFLILVVTLRQVHLSSRSLLWALLPSPFSV